MDSPSTGSGKSPLSPRFVIEPVAKGVPTSPPPKAIPPPPPRTPLQDLKRVPSSCKKKASEAEDGRDHKHVLPKARRASKIEFVKDLHENGGRATYSASGGIVRVCCAVECTQGCNEARDLVMSASRTRFSSGTMMRPPLPSAAVPSLVAPLGGRRSSHPYANSETGTGADSETCNGAEVASANDTGAMNDAKSPTDTNSISSIDSLSASHSHSQREEMTTSACDPSAEHSSQWSARSALDTQNSLQKPGPQQLMQTAIQMASPPLPLYSRDINNKNQGAPDPPSTDVKIDIPSNPKDNKSRPWVIGGASEVTCPRELQRANHLLERTGSFQGTAMTYIPPPSKTTRFLNVVFSTTATAIGVSIQIVFGAVLCFFSTCKPLFFVSFPPLTRVCDRSFRVVRWHQCGTKMYEYRNVHDRERRSTASQRIGRRGRDGMPYDLI
jgi:hypothetical protein